MYNIRVRTEKGNAISGFKKPYYKHYNIIYYFIFKKVGTHIMYKWTIETPQPVRGHFRRIKGIYKWIDKYYRSLPNK